MKVKIGRSVFVGDHTVISAPLASELGSQCLIGSRVHIGQFLSYLLSKVIGSRFTIHSTFLKFIYYFPNEIGTGVTLSACTLEDNCTIGNGAVLGAGVVVGKGAVIAGGAYVPANTIIPTGQVLSFFFS